MSNVYVRAVRKAAELVGGRARLARMLQVTEDEIEKWLAEERQPPRELFLRVVDIVIDDAAGGADAGPGEASPSRDASGRSQGLYD